MPAMDIAIPTLVVADAQVTERSVINMSKFYEENKEFIDKTRLEIRRIKNDLASLVEMRDRYGEDNGTWIRAFCLLNEHKIKLQCTIDEKLQIKEEPIKEPKILIVMTEEENKAYLARIEVGREEIARKRKVI